MADIVIFYELPERELNNANLLKAEFERRGYSVDIKDYGVIKLELDGDTAPITVAKFVKLAESGFYDGLTFHRIISGFMIQGGGYTVDGTHKEAESIKGEFRSNGVDNPLKHTRGVLSMARTMIPNSASSQFFFMHEDAPHLDVQYAEFGSVTDGMDVVDAIADTRTDFQDKPLEDQVIKTIRLA